MIRFTFYFLCLILLMNISINLWFSGEFKIDMVSIVIACLGCIFGYLTYRKRG